MADKKTKNSNIGEAFIGTGGEIHQVATKDVPNMTTSQGVIVSDNQNSLTAGANGPTLMEDFHFREKIFHFDHERIPERVVHARGIGMHGYFETLNPIPQYSKAAVFQKAGERTPVFARLSTVVGSEGSMDVARDVRGFAVKFYTKEGNWDLVGNNIPVFFIQDAIKFPDLIHAAKPEPDRAFPQAQSAHDNFWDFISFTPESMHMIMWLMSDRAIPRSLRFMEGFGVHTFRLINEKGESSFVKFHWKPKFGMQSVVWNEAVKINGADPDFHRRDMWEMINAGKFPEWELCAQIFPTDFNFGNEFGNGDFSFDILDSTKLIPEEICPVQVLGKMVLNRMPDNFFAETEQVAFCTQNIIPGIDFTDDPLLQGRNFSYLDTQLKRLGSTNFTHLPINAPKCPFHNFLQDGHMAFHNPKGRANYEPNGWGAEQGGPREQPNGGFVHHPVMVEGAKLRSRSKSFSDHYSQARQFYISQTPVEQKHIQDAFTFELSKCEHLRIRESIVGHLRNIDEDLAKIVATNLNLAKMPEPAKTLHTAAKHLKPSDALSILKNPPKSFAGRKIGVFISDEIDEKPILAFEKFAQAQDVVVERIAMKVGGFLNAKNQLIPVHHLIKGAPSVLFDAVAIFINENQLDKLVKCPELKDFANDAYAHYKFIIHNKGALKYFEKIALLDKMDKGFIQIENNKEQDILQMLAKLRFWDRADGC